MVVFSGSVKVPFSISLDIISSGGEITEIGQVAQMDLFNEGGLDEVSEWPFAKFDIPSINEDNVRLRIRAELNSTAGLFAIDNIKFTTQQKCSPK